MTHDRSIYFHTLSSPCARFVTSDRFSNQTKPARAPRVAEDQLEPNPSSRTRRRSLARVSPKLADRDARTRSIARTLDAPRASSQGAANRDDRESLFQTEIDRYRKLDRHE